MGTETRNDFSVASNGHCFFCLDQIMALKRQPDLSSSSPLAVQPNSLQYLTRYLKMDLKKVFIDKGQVSPELLATVAKARLKVALCAECRCLSERFSEGYRQLEKLELELESTLSLIHGKLASADVTGKLRGLTTGLLDSNWNGLLEVLDILREEAIHKSSQRLAGEARVKIQNLSRKEINAKQFRLEKNSGYNHNQQEFQIAASPHYSSECGLEETTVVKTESLNGECLSDNDNGNDFSNVDYNLDSAYIEDGQEMRKLKFKKTVNAGDNKDKIVCNIVTLGTTNRLENKKWSINPETGKHKCNVCQKEFSNSTTFNYHYQAVHLNVRYKCVSCNKLFSHNKSLRLHQRTSRSCSGEVSVSKFNCHLCAKSFTLKHHLRDHLDGVHFKSQKYECNTCEKKFNTGVNLNKHKRRVHRQLK